MAAKLSAFRMDVLTGKRYVLDLLSGNIEVRHFDFPIVTSTLIEPNPAARSENFFFISTVVFLFIVRKCQAASPG